ncbi:hypothetical protein [Telmatospirillum sp.]|uniref:hypothetical protein n=1 Tax=Telmatospirillum sp. TaxID=2079197 RepID=UPI0028438013|nr:hypothetical protein [Telmatospirillum sp.]MDR3438724.1 hypothetical protein [Telmatospirillum sp.]
MQASDSDNPTLITKAGDYIFQSSGLEIGRNAPGGAVSMGLKATNRDTIGKKAFALRRRQHDG